MFDFSLNACYLILGKMNVNPGAGIRKNFFRARKDNLFKSNTETTGPHETI